MAQPLVCSKCGHQNPSIRLTCEKCAYYLPPPAANALTCSKCGHRNPLNRATCEKCFNFLRPPDTTKPIGAPDRALRYAAACGLVAVINFVLLLIRGYGIAEDPLLDMIVIIGMGALAYGLVTLSVWVRRAALIILPVLALLAFLEMISDFSPSEFYGGILGIGGILYLFYWFYTDKTYFQN